MSTDDLLQHWSARVGETRDGWKLVSAEIMYFHLRKPKREPYVSLLFSNEIGARDSLLQALDRCWPRLPIIVRRAT